MIFLWRERIFAAFVSRFDTGRVLTEFQLPGMALKYLHSSGPVEQKFLFGPSHSSPTLRALTRWMS